MLKRTHTKRRQPTHPPAFQELKDKSPRILRRQSKINSFFLSLWSTLFPHVFFQKTFYTVSALFQVKLFWYSGNLVFIEINYLKNYTKLTILEWIFVDRNFVVLSSFSIYPEISPRKGEQARNVPFVLKFRSYGPRLNQLVNMWLLEELFLPVSNTWFFGGRERERHPISIGRVFFFSSRSSFQPVIAYVIRWNWIRNPDKTIRLRPSIPIYP